MLEKLFQSEYQVRCIIGGDIINLNETANWESNLEIEYHNSSSIDKTSFKHTRIFSFMLNVNARKNNHQICGNILKFESRTIMLPYTWTQFDAYVSASETWECKANTFNCTYITSHINYVGITFHPKLYFSIENNMVPLVEKDNIIIDVFSQVLSNYNTISESVIFTARNFDLGSHGTSNLVLSRTFKES